MQQLRIRETNFAKKCLHDAWFEGLELKQTLFATVIKNHHIFHPPIRNAIKASKSRPQVILNGCAPLTPGLQNFSLIFLGYPDL